MLDKNDLILIRQVIKEEVQASEKRMVDRIDQSVRSSEKRMIDRINSSIKASEQKLSGKIDQLGEEIGAFIDTTILPQLEEKADKADIVRLEVKLDRVIEKNIELEVDIKKLKTKVFPN